MRFELGKLRPDEMTREERLGALAQGKPLDRVPVMPYFAGAFYARMVGASLRSHYEDPEKCFFDQLLCCQMLGHDGSPTYGFAEKGGYDFGGEIRLPRSEYDMAPLITRYAAATEEEAWKLKLPDNVETMGFNPYHMKWIKLAQKYGGAAYCAEAEPFCTALSMVGAKNLFRWMITKPELCHHLLRLATEHIVRVVQYWVDTLGKGQVRFNTWTGPEENRLTSGKQFEEFAFPYVKEVHERVLASGVIPSIWLHICGDHNQNLPYWAQVPLGDFGWVSIGTEVDITTAVKYLGDTNIIMGNISTQLLRDGTPQQVYEACRKAIEKGKKAPRGFILMSACEVPPQTPPVNLWAMRRAVSDFGWY